MGDDVHGSDVRISMRAVSPLEIFNSAQAIVKWEKVGNSGNPSQIWLPLVFQDTT
jgi:hypothetical protein